MTSNDFVLGAGTHTEPETWEDAATAAAFQVWLRFEPKPMSINALAVTSRFFDMIANEAFGHHHKHHTWLADRFGLLGARALWGADLATTEVKQHLARVVELIAGKQHDYGHGNILRFGVDGIIVRLSDKLARLENLTKRYADLPMRAANEPIADTWDDIVGYSIIAVMLVNDTFELPLAADADLEARAGLTK